MFLFAFHTFSFRSVLALKAINMCLLLLIWKCLRRVVKCSCFPNMWCMNACLDKIRREEQMLRRCALALQSLFSSSLGLSPFAAELVSVSFSLKSPGCLHVWKLSLPLWVYNSSCLSRCSLSLPLRHLTHSTSPITHWVSLHLWPAYSLLLSHSHSWLYLCNSLHLNHSFTFCLSSFL